MFADVFNNDDGHPRGGMFGIGTIALDLTPTAAHWSVGAASDSAVGFSLA